MEVLRLPLLETKTNKHIFHMPYIPEISKNSCKFPHGGIKPHVRKWMNDLSLKIADVNVPQWKQYVIGIHGHFLDERRPDIPNFFDIVLDAVQNGLNVNDKYFRARDDGYETGYIRPELIITIEETQMPVTFVETTMSKGMTVERAMKGVVLLSGGLDSTVLLTKLVREGNDCYPFSVEYGQRHAKELFAARHVCEALGLKERHQVLFLGQLKELIHSALTGDGDIPFGHYTDEIQKVTVFPNRNMILLGIAAGYAETIGGEFVAYAAHSNDRAIYADCRPEFVRSVAETIKLGTDGKVRLIEPFVDYRKADIVYEGFQIEAPLALTWSCYLGDKRPCLRCSTCIERTEAFALDGTKDPALSDEEWKKALEYLKQYTS